MKYGINQWARISSLLVRKSAKQCKARWYEWLDPGIKKTEWTRDEDERLLHLAKLMPTQWRTIAPIVGRTPAQCLERYEKLLDAACAREEGYDGADDPRRLRPGEIDPNPESKPARPDPVDMEEDEKEMLSEARARLANTRGKKAKRKAREKQLEEARRLASLQKRRELKAAGIVSRGGGRRIQGIDYNAEIAFEKRAPAGFFDTSAERAAEQAAADKPFKPITLAQLEGTRRKDIEEALMKRDAKRQKILERNDAPAALAQLAQQHDGDGTRKRSRLMLPSPQVSERDLEEIARLGGAGSLALEDLGGGSGATQALLADYAATPSASSAPLRTPRTAAVGGGGDFILQEAENLARLQQGKTPLLGGDNPMLHPSDFTGVTPRRKEAATPHPLATPFHTADGATPRVAASPGRGASFGATPARTPMRDQLSINGPDGIEREERARLREGLSSLPQPRNEYLIVVPDLPADTGMDEDFMEEDAADARARMLAEEEAAAAAARRKWSHAVQRQLPRPDKAPASLDAAGSAKATPLARAEALLLTELTVLLAHDAAKHPTPAAAAAMKADKVRPPTVPALEDFSEEALRDAGALVRADAEAVREAMGHKAIDAEEHERAWGACFTQRYRQQTLEQLQAEFARVRADMEKDARRASKLDAKATLLTAGYQRRAAELQTKVDEVYEALAAKAAELHAFQRLHAQELRSAPLRIEARAAELEVQTQREQALQARYAAAVAVRAASPWFTRLAF
jgi:pre-mRNA-splicing factor CDC5/CEF1